jgi:hypothetical protein
MLARVATAACRGALACLSRPVYPTRAFNITYAALLPRVPAVAAVLWPSN